MWRCSNNINISSPSAKMCFINRAISFAYKMYKTPDPSLPSNDMANPETNTQKESLIFWGRTLHAEDVFWKCLMDLCIFAKCWCSIVKNENNYFVPYPGSIHDSSEALRVFFAFDIPAGWHWWRGAGLSYSSLLTLKTAADQLTQQVAMMF